jgi:flagellar motility protein MotE (MotC chaperone)
MRGTRIAIVVGIALETTFFGAWWWTGLAAAERMESRDEPATAAVPGELFAKSRGFRDLLQAVEQRGAELDRRERAVVEREAALKALEAALDEQVMQLERAAPAGTPAEAASEPAGCGVAVTKIYASMKPEDAAPILDRLDEATARTVLGCMKERQIGAILAAMNRDRAVALTRLLAAGS